MLAWHGSPSRAHSTGLSGPYLGTQADLHLARTEQAILTPLLELVLSKLSISDRLGPHKLDITGCAKHADQPADSG